MDNADRPIFDKKTKYIYIDIADIVVCSVYSLEWGVDQDYRVEQDPEEANCHFLPLSSVHFLIFSNRSFFKSIML